MQLWGKFYYQHSSVAILQGFKSMAITVSGVELQFGWTSELFVQNAKETEVNSVTSQIFAPTAKELVFTHYKSSKLPML